MPKENKPEKLNYVNRCSLKNEQNSTWKEAEYFKGLADYPHGILKLYTILSMMACG